MANPKNYTSGTVKAVCCYLFQGNITLPRTSSRQLWEREGPEKKGHADVFNPFPTSPLAKKTKQTTRLLSDAGLEIVNPDQRDAVNSVAT